jgi:purine-nucleoside phosphorylase
MGKGIPAYFSHSKHNIKPEDVCRSILYCEPQDIRNEVIVTPIWGADFLSKTADEVTSVSENHVYDVHYHGKIFTLIRSGMGAPCTGDVALALGCTPCRRFIFTGSFGGLTEKLTIGDLLTITESISGDGYSSYLEKGELTPRKFLKPAKPDAGLNALLKEHAASVSDGKNMKLHQGRIFCTDTIVAQFHHLDMITGKLSCVGIEMETSSVFNAAALVGVPAAALLITSDVIPVSKSLFSGRTPAERENYQQIKRSVLSRIILDTLSDTRLSKI